MSATKVCVVGGGPSGLAVLRAFQSKEGVEVACLEKQDDCGGLWNFSMATGLDEFGEPVHGSMYRYLWSNGPKEGLEFSDYSFEEHFGKPIPSYPPRAVLWDYIKGRIEKSSKLNAMSETLVNLLTKEFKDGLFHVTWADTNVSPHKVCSDVFDYCIIASGHFSFPHKPVELLDMFSKFKGKLIHAHDFRDALDYKNQNVLMIGTEDIASQIWKYGSKSITISWRSKPLGFKWPEGIKEVPLVQSCIDNTVFFKDGSSDTFDAIILCTGYEHYFPFFKTDELKLITDNRLWPTKLYKGVVWEDNPKMQDQYYTFNMFDAQAWLVRDIILKRVPIPSLEEMQRDNGKWRKRELELKDAHDQIVFQGDYVKELLSLTDYPTFDVDAVNEAFFEWKHHKEIDIMAFRDYPFKSIMTGTVSPVHHTKWTEALDDTLECYLKDKI